MEYEALITLDLPGATDEKRQLFYHHLATKQWNKIMGLTTAWKVIFTATSSRIEIIKRLRGDITEAKAYSKVTLVSYAIQVDQNKIVIEKQ